MFYIPYFKNKSFLFKFSLTAILTSIITFILFITLWNYSEDPRVIELKEMEELQNNYKKIIFQNSTKQRIYLEVNFEYTKEEIKENKLNILDYYNFNKKFILESKDENMIILPIKINNHIDFPNNFIIIIKDSSSNVIQRYNEKIFLEKAILESHENFNKIKTNKWLFEIK